MRNKQFFPTNFKNEAHLKESLPLGVSAHGSLNTWGSTAATDHRHFQRSAGGSLPAQRCAFWKPASLSPLQMKSLNAKSDRLTLEATASLFKSRTQLHSFPLHRGGRKWSCACFTSLSTAQQWCDSATAVHSPGRRLFVCFSFSSACGRCLTLATDISCPGTHQVQDIKQRRQQQPLCLEPSKDRDTFLPADQLKEGYDFLSATNPGHCWRGERLCISLPISVTLKTFQIWITESAF